MPKTPASPAHAPTLDARSRAFHNVVEALRCLQESGDTKTEWQALAHRLGWTADHMQRVFADWAGISPKRFLQVLRMQSAGKAMQESSVLEASLQAGLSSPGRLHDLVVACEAATPGEWKSGGKGLRVTSGFGATPFGDALLAWTDRGITFLQFTSQLEPVVTRDELTERLHQHWPAATHHREDSEASTRLAALFGHHPPSKPLHLFVRGTNFQVQVWRALLDLPSNTTTSYGALADSLGHPQGARAIAGAVAANPIGILIPCHRVLRADGTLGGYRWGLERKRALLALESIGSQTHSSFGANEEA